jgi:uncharacterized RDD family membrane protein YckC
MTDQYLKEFERWVAGPKAHKQHLRAELEAHLREAEAVGDAGALSRFGTPREAAEAFSQGYAPPVASPWRRLVAAVTDMAVIMAAGVIVSLLAFLIFRGRMEAAFLIFTFGAMLWWAVGLTLFEWKNGRTPGKGALGLRVITESGTAPSFWQVVVRRLTLVFSGPLQLIDWGFMFFNEKHQRGLDILAKTLVVNDPSENTAPIGEAANAHP